MTTRHPQVGTLVIDDTRTFHVGRAGLEKSKFFGHRLFGGVAKPTASAFRRHHIVTSFLSDKDKISHLIATKSGVARIPFQGGTLTRRAGGQLAAALCHKVELGDDKQQHPPPDYSSLGWSRVHYELSVLGYSKILGLVDSATCSPWWWWWRCRPNFTG